MALRMRHQGILQADRPAGLGRTSEEEKKAQPQRVPEGRGSDVSVTRRSRIFGNYKGLNIHCLSKTPISYLSLIQSLVLQAEELFLLLNLAAQVFPCWHIGQILGCIQLVAAVQHGIMRHIVVGVCTEN